MNREQRAALIRAGTKKEPQTGPVKPLGLYRAQHPREPDRRELKRVNVPREVPPKIYLPWPQIIPDSKRAPGWMRVPDENVEDMLPVDPSVGGETMQRMAAKWLAAMQTPAGWR